MDHKDRSRALRMIGLLLLAVGVVCAFLGPVEMYCFYLFAEGGPFHYAGFGFGSLMFGYIAVQIVGYYAVALVCIPLGYGNIRVRRWARTLSLALLWFWLIVGLPLTILFFLILVTAKDLSLAAVVAAALVLVLSYPAVPILLILFYQSRDVRWTFAARDPNSYAVERIPLHSLVLATLYLFWAVVLHVPILFRGIYPAFGVLLFDLPGFLALDVSILLLVGLIWGTLTARGWAWWGGLLTFSALTFSTIWTFARYALSDILAGMHFPPKEMGILRGVPLHGVHLAVFFGVPLLGTLVAILLSKKHFATGRPARG